jgi:hypothetical protein
MALRPHTLAISFDFGSEFTDSFLPGQSRLLSSKKDRGHHLLAASENHFQ